MMAFRVFLFKVVNAAFESDTLLQAKTSTLGSTHGVAIDAVGSEEDCSVLVTDEEGCVSVVDHGHNERCTFNMPALPLHVVQFNTEQCCDKLTVNGIRYSGRNGPEGVTPNGPLSWYSDSSVGGGIFKICPVGSNPPAQDTSDPPSYELMPPPSICHRSDRIDTAAECSAAYNAIQSEYGLTNTRGLQQGHWNGVPYGCSVQWNTAMYDQQYDQAPHWNTYSDTDNSRVTNGEFLRICKSPAAPSPDDPAAPDDPTAPDGETTGSSSRWDTTGSPSRWATTPAAPDDWATTAAPDDWATTAAPRQRTTSRPWRETTGTLPRWETTGSPPPTDHFNTTFISGVLRNVAVAGQEVPTFGEEFQAAAWCRANSVCLGYLFGVHPETDDGVWMPLVAVNDANAVQHPLSCIMAGVVEISGEGILDPSLVDVKVKVYIWNTIAPETPCAADGNEDHRDAHEEVWEVSATITKVAS